MISLAHEIYREWKAYVSKKSLSDVKSSSLGVTSEGINAEYSTKKSNRDPKALGDVLQSLMSEKGWSEEVQTVEVLETWPEIVGDQIASRTTVTHLTGGVLHIECDSTPWAIQLKAMKFDILQKIENLYPDSLVKDIKFNVSGLPNWKHGARSVQGRGPRDTYK